MIAFSRATFFEIEIEIEIEGICLRRWRVRLVSPGAGPSALYLELTRPCGPGVGWVSSRVNGQGLLVASGQL